MRDYIHVQDLARAHLLALAATDPADGRTGAAEAPCAPLVCNLGSGSGFSNRQIVAAAESIAGRPIPHKMGPRRPGDPPVLVASSDRARDILGWQPQLGTLEAMLGSAWEWRRAHPEGYSE